MQKSQECALGHLHDKQLATLPMITHYELLFPAIQTKKKRLIYLKKNKITIFWLDIVRIIKPELLFCCINLWLSILLGYAGVWEVSGEQHSWHFQNTIKGTEPQSTGWQFWVVLNWPAVLPFCRNYSRAELSGTAPKECCSFPLLFSTSMHCPYTLSTTTGFITEAPKHNSNTN